MNWKKASCAAAGLLLLALPARSQTGRSSDNLDSYEAMIDKLLPTFREHLSLAQKLQLVLSKA